jgi:hypothetical protein
MQYVTGVGRRRKLWRDSKIEIKGEKGREKNSSSNIRKGEKTPLRDPTTAAAKGH